MPAWPMQHACAPLAVDLADTTLLQAMREAVGVLYNHTKDVPCYELPGTLRQRMPSFGARRGIALSRKGFMRCGLPCLPWDQRCRHSAHRPDQCLRTFRQTIRARRRRAHPSTVSGTGNGEARPVTASHQLHSCAGVPHNARTVTRSGRAPLRRWMDSRNQSWRTSGAHRCTEQLPDSFWFTTDGVRDMFWRNEYNQSLVDAHCASVWSVRPRVRWIADEYGGRKIGFGASNIVFSSGSFDLWSAGGIATNLSDSLFSIMIESGAHHLDLMFSHPSDPPSVVMARQFQLENIRKWIEQFALLTPAQSWGDMP